jgi:hypothetical protein
MRFEGLLTLECAPMPGLYAVSRAARTRPGAIPTALPHRRGLGSAQAGHDQGIPQPSQAAACRAVAAPCMRGRSTLGLPVSLC